jgi:hypothetical protein
MTVKCVVVCVAADGLPTLAAYEIECTQDEYDNGEHYDTARFMAEKAGYEQTSRAVVIDEYDGPAWLFANAFPIPPRPGESRGLVRVGADPNSYRFAADETSVWIEEDGLVACVSRVRNGHGRPGLSVEIMPVGDEHDGTVASCAHYRASDAPQIIVNPKDTADGS